MATASWPSTIPQCPVLNAFSEERQRNLAAFSPDIGLEKLSRRSTAVGTLTSVAYRMTIDQIVDFDTFYEITLKDGSLPFLWNHPITGTSYVWMFDSGEAPRFDRMTANTFRVTFNLLRMHI
jgi:hypothetical protein